MADVYDPLTDLPTRSKGTQPAKTKVYDPVADPYSEHSSFTTSAKRVGGNILQGVGQLAEDAGVPGGESLEHYGSEVQRANPSQIGGFGDIVSHPLTTLKEQTAETAAQLAPYAAGVYAGQKAGGKVGGATGRLVGGIVGGAAPIFAQEYGGIRSDQEREGTENVPRALAAATGATALESAFGPEGMVAKTALGKGVVRAGENRLQSLARGAATGAAEEFPTEFAQNAVEQVGASQDPTTAEALREDAFSGTLGAIGGGVGGAGVRALSPRVTEQADSDNAQPDEPDAETGENAPAIAPDQGGGASQPPALRDPSAARNYSQWAGFVDPTWLDAAARAGDPASREAAADLRVARNGNLGLAAREKAAERAADIIRSKGGMGVNQMPPDLDEGPLQAGLRRAGMQDVELLDAEGQPAAPDREALNRPADIEADYTGGRRSRQLPAPEQPATDANDENARRESLAALSAMPMTRARADQVQGALTQQGIDAEVIDHPRANGYFSVRARTDEGQTGQQPGTTDAGERQRAADRTREAQAFPGVTDEQPESRPAESQAPEQHATEAGEVYEQPLADLSLSVDVPQFKANANDDTGVVEPLQGTFDRTGVAPIQVWERGDGRREVISGRHRLDLARRSGETTIPAQLHREADGVSATQAAMLDAELNIRDEQGSINDYATYFKNTGLSQDEAESRGLLSRAKGRTGFSIAQSASDPLFAAHRAGQVSDEATRQISEAAPNDERLQSVGMDALNKGASIADAANTMRAVATLAAESSQQGDIFGFDDSAMRDAQTMAKIASGKQRAIRERIASVRGAAKRPDKARELGVNVKNPAAVNREIKRLEGEARRWDNWNTDPALVEQIRSEMGDEPARGTPVVTRDNTPDNAPTSASDMIGESSPKAMASLKRLQDDPHAARINGDLLNGADSQGNRRPDWRDVGRGFQAREYVRDGQAIQEVRDSHGAIARRKMHRDGTTSADLEANATLDDFLSGAPFKSFEKFFGETGGPALKANRQGLLDSSQTPGDVFDTGATDAAQTLDAADRPENFGLTSPQRSDETAEAEAQGRFNAGQGDIFGGQTEAAQASQQQIRDAQAADQPDAGLGGGLFGNSSQAPASGPREIGHNSEGQTITEDANGVRSVDEGNGLRSKEPVKIEPGRGPVPRDPRERSGTRYETTDESADREATESARGQRQQGVSREADGLFDTPAETASPVEAAHNALLRERDDGSSTMFPAPDRTVNAGKNAGDMISAEAAQARVASWKATAREIGRTKDNADKVIISLFDASGSWSQPWRDAGYTVVQYDVTQARQQAGYQPGDEKYYDILERMPNADFEALRAEGKQIYGVLAATPCTTFASSGARWWKPLHDQNSREAIEKVFGPWVPEGFDSPREVNEWLVYSTEAAMEMARPSAFNVLENPIGRIAKQVGLPAPSLRFDPANYGDPYTKRTQLWGQFNTDLPTANVEPTEGSKMQSKLRGDRPEDKAARSKTPEGFAYAFFMANDPDARAAMQTQPKTADSDENSRERLSGIAETSATAYETAAEADARGNDQQPAGDATAQRMLDAMQAFKGYNNGATVADVVRVARMGAPESYSPILDRLQSHPDLRDMKVTAHHARSMPAGMSILRWGKSEARTVTLNLAYIESVIEGSETLGVGDSPAASIAEIITHELIHVATGRNLRNSARPSQLHDDMAAIRGDIRAWLDDPANADAVDDQTRGDLENMAESDSEVATYGLTARRVQDALKRMPSRMRGAQVWSKFVSAIRRFLGLDNSHQTLMDDVLVAADRAMNTDGGVGREQRAPSAQTQPEQADSTENSRSQLSGITEAPADEALPNGAIGRNRRGEPIFEDEDGVRSVKEGGIGIEEPVNFAPDVKHAVPSVEERPGSRYETADEADARTRTEQPSQASPQHAEGPSDQSQTAAAPEFESMEAANGWIRKRVRERGITKTEFYGTDEYHRAWPAIKAVSDREAAARAGRMAERLHDAGLHSGDAVQMTTTGLILGAGQTHTGTIQMRKGVPWVAVDGDGLTVNRGGKLSRAKRVRWDERWTPASKPETDKETSRDNEQSSRQSASQRDAEIQAEADRMAGQANRTTFPDVQSAGDALDYVRNRIEELGISRQAYMRTPEGKALSQHERDIRAGTRPKAQPAAASQAKGYGDSNTVFTADAAEAARAKLRAKLGQINTGFDPEVFQAGVTLAGYHIEAGARSFAAYARAMVADMGDGVRPFLKLFYNGVRDYPGFDATGMDSAAVVSRADISAIEPESATLETRPQPEASGDDRQRNSRDGQEPLAPASSELVREDQGERDAGRRSPRRGEADARRNGSARGGRRDTDAGVGRGQGSVRADGPDQGSRAAGNAERELGERLAPPDPTPEAAAPGPVEAGNSTPPGRARSAVLTGDNPGNYRITAADAIGTGTRGTRIDNNIAAIETVKALEAEGRYATPAEQAIMAKYVGWGGLKRVFQIDDKSKPQDRRANERLRALLTEAEFAAAQRSILDAHYTSPAVVRGLYDAVNHMGIGGGRVLEPSVGSGNFLGLMPEKMIGGARVDAVELDSVSAAIAKHLYPDAQVVNAGFQKANLPYAGYDLVIGNPPFGNTPITDTNKARKAISGFTIHNYFLAKSAMHLKPGGVMGVVVTNNFLDKPHSKERAYLAKQLQFLGAVRLSNRAFADSAGTEVTTDLVFFRKPTEAADLDKSPAWADAVEFANADGDTVRANEYFAERPHLMLGKPTMGGTMYGRGAQFTLEARPGQDIEADLAEVLRSPEFAGLRDIASQRSDQAAEVTAAEYRPNLEDLAIGDLALDGGQVMQRMDDDSDGNPVYRELAADTQWTEKTQLGDTRLSRIKGMLAVRNAAYQLMTAERLDSPDIEPLRNALNKEYDAFVKAHGYINDTANVSLLGKDLRVEVGLEGDYKPEISKAKAKRLGVEPRKASANKESLLTRRVNYPRRNVESVSSARDGYIVSLTEKGRLDLDYIAGLYDKPRSAVIAELTEGDKPLIYQDPETSNWIAEGEYLSGNVKAKLRAVEGLEGFEKNAASLAAVQPADVAPEHINANFGATWIPAEVYEQFADAIGIRGARVKVSPSLGVITVAKHQSTQQGGDYAEYRAGGLDQADVFNRLASGKPLVVRYTDRDGKSYVNEEATDALRQAAGAMREFFADWITAEPERATRVADVFNETMNTTIEREYDGSLLRLTGANPTIELRDSQARAAWRMVQSDRTLLDHVVGAGKTFTVIAGIMERRRMGLTRKPVVVVPNHKVGDWAREWLQMYPGANVLAATNKDFATKNRKRLFARMATGDYDAIIVGHSSFGFIPLLPENEAAALREQVAILERAKEELGDGGDSGQRRTVRNLENSKAKLEQRIEKLLDEPRDSVATIEEMGVDSLTVDESHEFKNLMISTSMSNIAGMGNLAGSKKAMHLFMVMRQIQKQAGSTYFATGTPIANTMTEMYTLLRYMNYEALEERNLEAFDAWARAHASVEERVEMGAGGKFKQRSVMATFQNMPELMQLYNQFADVVTMADLKRMYTKQVERQNAERGDNERAEFPVPKVKDGGRKLNLGEPNPLQEEYSEYLRARADALQEQGADIDPSVDNMLLVITDSRKMSMDIRMVDAGAGDYHNNKTSRAAGEVKRLYDAWAEQRGTQLVFSDLGTPVKFARSSSRKIIKSMLDRLPAAERERAGEVTRNMEPGDAGAYLADRMRQMIDAAPELDATLEKLQDYTESGLNEDMAGLVTAQAGFSVYDDLKDKLIRQGIPANEIAFIHDYNTPKAKSELFDLVNSGQIRVLMGSTAKMGAGTNVQERIVGLHHLDAPWRPADVEQREGRAIRQGNKLYGADPDNFEVEIQAYSTARTLDSMMWQTLARKQEMLGAFRNGTAREMADVYDDGTGYSDFMAESTGNPVFKEAAQLKLEAKDLRSRKRRVQAERAGAEFNVRALPARIETARADADKLKRAADAFATAEAGDIIQSDGSRIPADYDAKAQPLLDAYYDKLEAFEGKQLDYNRALERWKAAPPDTRGDQPKAPTRPNKPTLMTLGKQSKEAKFYADLRSEIENAATENRSHTVEYSVAGVPILVEFEPARILKQAALNGGTVAIGYNHAEPHEIETTALDRRLMEQSQPRTAKTHAAGQAKGRSVAADKAEQTLADAKSTLDKVQFKDGERLAAIEERLASANAEIEALEAELREKAQASGNRYMGGKKHLNAKFSRGGARPARGLDVARLRAALRQHFGDGIARMEAAGRLTLVDSDAELPERVRGRAAKGVVMVDEAGRPRVYLVADRLTTDNVKGVFLHEVGVHYGLADMLGDDAFADVLDRMAALHRIGNAAVRDAYARVPESTPLHLRDEEALGYLAESNPDLPLVRRLIARLKAFLFRAFGIGANRLSADDMGALVAASASRTTRSPRGVAQAGAAQPAFSESPSFAQVFSDFAPQTAWREARTFDEARDEAQAFKNKPLTNLASGITAQVSGGSINKMLSSSAVSKSDSARAQSKAVANLDTLFAHAVRGWDKPDRNNDRNITRIHRFFAPLEVDGRALLVKMTVKEMAAPGESNPLYSVESVEFNEKTPAATWVDADMQRDRGARRPTLSAGAVSKLAQRVQDFNENRGARYDTPRFSIDATMDGDEFAEPVDDAKAEALRRSGLAWATKTPRERMTASMADHWADFKTNVLGRWREGFFDRFAPIKALEGDLAPEQSGYLAARLSTGASSTLYASLLHGAPQWRGGIIQKKANTRGLLSIMAPIKGEMNEWLGWMVAKRAQYLADQGRENNMRPEDIDALMRDVTGEKRKRFEQVAKEFRAFNTDLLAMARDAGLLSAAQVEAFARDEYYIPFYRVDESETDADPAHAYIKRSLSHQDAGIKTLKGGSQALHDPLQNVFSNMQRLIDASLKNHAMRQITRNTAHLMTPEPEGNRADPDVVRVMDDGQAHYYRVADRALVRSLAGINAGPIAGLGVFRSFKRLLTQGVTADPAFMIRNFTRDMLQSWLVDKNGFTMVTDSLRGGRDVLRSLRDKDNVDPGLESIMFAGASFIGGHAYGNDPASQANALRRALRAKGLTPDGIDSHLESIVDTPARWWSAYRELGDATENANRMAVYRAAIKAGRSPIEAVYESKDVMDFSLQGSFTFIKVMSDMIPFFNARLQGLYKVGRAFDDNPQQLTRRGLMVVGATLALVAANMGNDDYDDLPEWDKDMYWHLFLPGGAHLRIPKPFELGIMFGTIPERMARRAMGSDTNAESYKALIRNLGQVMAFDPTPQLINPALETYMNWDKFRDAPIENMSDEGRLPGSRYSAYTSATMTEIGRALNVSPKKLEHLWNGYLGTLGSYVLNVSDFMVRHARGDIGPSMTTNDVPLVSAFVRNANAPARSTKYAGEFYELLSEANQVYRTINQYRESGQIDRARSLLESNRGLLEQRQSLTAAQRQASAIRDRMDQVRASTTLTATDKRERLDRMQKMLNHTMKSTVEASREAASG